MSRRARARFDKRIILNPMQVAMGGVSKLQPQDVLELRAIMDRAFTRFRAGIDAAVQWPIMADAMNVAEALSEHGIASNESSRDCIAHGKAALADVHQRHQRTGSWALRFDAALQRHEIKVLDDALFIHGVQLAHCSVGEYDRAVRTVKHRMQSALAGNTASGTLVCVGALQ